MSLIRGKSVKLKQRLLVGMMGLGLMANATASLADNKGSFSPQQQTEIKSIIKNYLVQNPEVLLEVSDDVVSPDSPPFESTFSED